MPQMLDELGALHEAIVGKQAYDAEHLWREKAERWVSDMVDQLAGGFDRDVWVALISGGAALQSS